jgi:hypothetical protein
MQALAADEDPAPEQADSTDVLVALLTPASAPTATATPDDAELAATGEPAPDPVPSKPARKRAPKKETTE